MELIKVAIADANIFLREGLKRILTVESDLLIVGEAADNVEVADVVERTRPMFCCSISRSLNGKPCRSYWSWSRKKYPPKFLSSAPFLNQRAS